MKATKKVRDQVMDRDRRCYACGSQWTLTFQHRAAVGAGGSKVTPSVVDGIVACLVCNVQFEAGMQTLALVCGWKVRRWVGDQGLTGQIPVFDWANRTWWALKSYGMRQKITSAKAEVLMKTVYEQEWSEWLGELTDFERAWISGGF